MITAPAATTSALFRHGNCGFEMAKVMKYPVNTIEVLETSRSLVRIAARSKVGGTAGHSIAAAKRRFHGGNHGLRRHLAHAGMVVRTA